MSQMSHYPGTSQSTGMQWARSTACPSHQAERPQNVSETERLISTVGGSALLLLGLSRGKLGGLLTTLVGGSLIYRGMTGHCHMYEALGINTAEGHNFATAIPAQQGVKIERTIVVNRSPEELYDFWRRFENLPRVMGHLERVEEIDQKRSRWFAKGPFDKAVEWTAEIITDRRPDVISWRSLPGSEVDTAGSVHFKPLDDGQGTAIAISLKYDPPAGKLGATIASLLGQGLEQDLDADLNQFKRRMESGEFATVQGQSHI